MKKGKENAEAFDISQTLGGTLQLFGLNLDLGKLISSPEDASSQLESLRQRLKDLGAREVLGDEEWKKGATSVSGHLRVRDLSGEREYHIGTSVGRRPRRKSETVAEQPEIVEPPVDVFNEDDGVTVIADVPGISLDDLQIEFKDHTLSISTKPSARRGYNKTIQVAQDVDGRTIQSTCRNGVLEIRLKKNTDHGH